jgi:Phosphate transport (Pho88)
MNPKNVLSELLKVHRYRNMMSSRFWNFVATVFLLLTPDAASALRRPYGRLPEISIKRRSPAPSLWFSSMYIPTFPRGGTSLNEADEDEDTVEDEEMSKVNGAVTEIAVEPSEPEIVSIEDNEKDTEEDDDDQIKAEVGVEEEEDEDDEDEADDIGNEIDIEGVQIELKVEKYDDPYFASPMSSLYASLGVMLLSRKVDLFHPTMVRIARFVFILYIVLHQCFLFYVRIQAKQNNDRTPIEMKNPFSALLQNQLGGSTDGLGGNSLVKNLASSLLSSKSTVLDYDLKQARSLQSGLIFNMAFMWFLHFKMEQVQPLLIQSVNGFISLVYNPLFQAYVLGRNLERPFKTNALMDKVAEGSTAVTDADDAKDDAVAENDDVESADEGIVVEGGDADDDTAVGSDDNLDGE